MFPKVIKAYLERGYRVDLGNPSRLFSQLYDIKRDRPLSTGGGFSLSDALLFTGLSRLDPKPEGVFIIGNAFGLSTFVIADLFPETTVDVIDAESEGGDNGLGSQITRDIARELFPNVRLTTGFSPLDLPKAFRLPSYQLLFVDGLHTNRQMVSDFQGMLPRMDKSAIVIFHDVVLCRMLPAWERVRELGKEGGFIPFELGFTSFGLTALARNYPAAESYLESIQKPFNESRYTLGIPYTRNRPEICNRTLFELEQSVRYRVSKLVTRSSKVT